MKDTNKKVLGIILELNPPHNGHKYFIEEAIKKVNPDYTIAVISSSFTMRGDISIISKWDKAKIALKLGVNLVMDLPFLSTINSADFFGENSLRILLDMGITDLAFGAELDSIDKLKQMNQLTSSIEFNSILKSFLDKGLSYTGSNLKALTAVTTDQEIISSFSLPNNMLAMQYLKFLDKQDKNINITLIKRIDNNYFDTSLTGSISSASSIREAIVSGKDISKTIPYPIKPIDINKAYKTLYSFIQYSLITYNKEKLINVWGIHEGIENRLLDNICESNYDSFIQKVQTKRYPANKIKRLLLHILLKTDKCLENKSHYYLRVMAFDKIGEKYLKTLPQDIKGNLITTFKNNDNYVVRSEILASKLYSIITNNNSLYLEEYKVPFKGEENDN